MTCRQVEDENLAGRYLAGGLTNGERKVFEEHYFACDRCFEALEASRVARSALMAAGPAAVETRPRKGWVWSVPIGIAAAIVIAIVGLKVAERPAQIADKPADKPAASAPRENVDLALLARAEPPAYSAPKFRDVPDPEARQFSAAMEHYVQRDYPATIAALRPLLSGSKGLDALFFTAACHLLTGDADAAIVELQRVADAGDRSPYAEESYYLLAKAYLGKNNVAQARAELEKVVGLNGDLRSQAKDLLGRLP